MRPIRRVLMTADTVGGVWTYALELCAGLARHGVEVTLFTQGRLPDEDQQVAVSRLGNIELVHTAYKTEWMQDSAADQALSGLELQRLVEERDPDIIHLNSYWHAGLAFSVPVIVAAHSCVLTWWQTCRNTPLPEEWAPYASWVARAVDRADLLVAPTTAFLESFQAIHGHARNARAIHNGRTTDLFKPGVKRRIVLAAGRAWDEAKNIGLLSKIASDVDTPIVLAGELVGPDGAIFEAGGIAALGHTSQVETARWMAEAAIFASPARYEPFGLSTLEAALSGCALILSDIPSYRELWDGVATFVRPDDAQGMKRAIRMLTEMPQLAASDGRKARERALQYSTPAMADAYYAAYRELTLGLLEQPAGGVAA